MAKGRKTALAVRAVAMLFALALAALAARLWLGDAPRETGATRAGATAEKRAGAGDSTAADAVSAAPPLHGEHSSEDQEALRGILRGAEGEAP